MTTPRFNFFYIYLVQFYMNLRLKHITEFPQCIDCLKSLQKYVLSLFDGDPDKVTIPWEVLTSKR